MNILTDLANTTASGAVTEAGVMLTGPIGQVVIFFLAFTVLSIVLVVLYKIFGRRG